MKQIKQFVLNSEIPILKENTIPLKILDHCKWPPEIMTVPLKCMPASAPLKKNTP